jgi:hypothetical protein
MRRRKPWNWQLGFTILKKVSNLILNFKPFENIVNVRIGNSKIRFNTEKNSISMRRVAEMHGVSHSTLQRALAGKQVIKSQSAINQQLLMPEEEKALKIWCLDLAKWGFPVRIDLSVRFGAGRGQLFSPRTALDVGRGSENRPPPRPGWSGAPDGERCGASPSGPVPVHRAGPRSPSVHRSGPRLLRWTVQGPACLWWTVRGPVFI